MAETVPEESFEVGGDDSPGLSGSTQGKGIDLILCHGLSATRDSVVHGSKFLPRNGFRLHTYDARAHGISEPPGSPGGFTYSDLTADLLSVIEGTVNFGPVALGGHSMGCHTVARTALERPEAASALILIGPVYTGNDQDPGDDRWDARADALERGGAAAFADEIASDFKGPPAWADTVWRIAFERASRHSDPAAVARALREVPRSMPFHDLSDLSGIQVPTLVVGSRDEADPGHPLASARAWHETIPGSEFIVEEPGESPLPWQGGRLSRIISEFIGRHLPRPEGGV